MTGVTLDTGALLALERGNPWMIALIRESIIRKVPLAVPAAVLAQAWRASARQVRVARLLSISVTEIVPLNRPTALAIGKLCRQTGASDVVDVSVVVCAQQRQHRVVTSDPGDLAAIDPELTLLSPASAT
jgi:PIN domain nuclease of toxin-antitoxin system